MSQGCGSRVSQKEFYEKNKTTQNLRAKYRYLIKPQGHIPKERMSIFEPIKDYIDKQERKRRGFK